MFTAKFSGDIVHRKTLQTDGRGYILTDYVPNAKTSKIEVKFRTPDLTKDGFLFMSSYDIATAFSKAKGQFDEFGAAYWKSLSAFQFYNDGAGGNAVVGSGYSDNAHAHVLTVQGNTVSLDGAATAQISGTAQSQTAGSPLLLFAKANASGQLQSEGTFRVQYVKVWEGTSLVRDWTPAIDGFGVATLYDQVSKKCLEVSGGTFAVDNVVDPDAEEPPEPPDPTDVIASATVSGDVFRLTFRDVTKPLVLVMFSGATDRGDSYYNDPDAEEMPGWDAVAPVARLLPGTTTLDVPVPAGWGTTVKYARFFATAASKTPWKSLVSIGGTDPAAQWLDTGVVPDATLNTQLNFKPTSATAGKPLFAAATEGANSPYLRYGISLASDRRPTFLYSNSNATGGNGRGESFGSAALTVGVEYNALLQATSNRAMVRPDGGSWSYSGTATAPTAAANGTIRVHGSCDITRLTVNTVSYDNKAYMMPALAYNEKGELEACLYDSKTHALRFSLGSQPFAAGAETSYHQDLLRGINLCGETATLTYQPPLISIAGGKTSNCVWTGSPVHPPLICNGVRLTPGTDYTYTIDGETLEPVDVGSYANVKFTGIGSYTGSFTAATWSIVRVTYYWDTSADGDWDSASWRCTAYDPNYGNYGKEYLEKVSRFPNATIAHYAHLERGVAVTLGTKPRAVYLLYAAGDTIQDGTLAFAATLQMTGAVKRVTFRNVTLEASSPETTWTELNPASGGTVAFEGDNSIGEHVRLRSSVNDDQTFVFRDGDTVSTETFTLWRSSDTTARRTVRFAVTNATVSLASISNMNGTGGLYDLKMAFGLGSLDARTKPLLVIRAGAMTLSADAALSVDVGSYATSPGTYRLIGLSSNSLTFGGKSCQAFCDAMAENVTGKDANYVYQLVPAEHDRGVNLVISPVVRNRAEVDGRTYATLAEACEAAHPGDTLRLLAAPTADDPLVLKPGVTVDLNGTVEKLAEGTYTTPGDWFDVSAKSGMVTITLNDKACPTTGDGGAESAFVVGDDAVSITVGNVKPNLYYGLAVSVLLDGLDSAIPMTWQQADAKGDLAPLTLAKPAAARSAFFRVKASDCGPSGR